MKSNYFVSIVFLLFCLTSVAQRSVAPAKIILEESEWLGFNTTIYLDTTNAYEHINKDIVVKFAISSNELNATELKRRLEGLKMWTLEEYGVEGNLLVVKMKASIEDHKKNRLYILNKMRCIKTIVNGKPMDIEKVKSKINS